MTGDKTVRIYSRMARILYCGVLIIAIVATLGGMVDPTPGPDQPEIFPGVLFVAIEAALLIRSLRIGLVIDGHQVTSRGLVRTRKFPRASVTKVDPTGYSGMANWGGTSGLLMMLRLQIGDRSIELPQLIGSANAVRGLADTAHAALALPDPPSERRGSRAPREPADPQEPTQGA